MEVGKGGGGGGREGMSSMRTGSIGWHVMLKGMYCWRTYKNTCSSISIRW